MTARVSGVAAGALALALAGCAGHATVKPRTGSTRDVEAAAARGCPTSALAVWLGLGQGGAAAGSTYYPLEFTNVSRRSCRLFGFPGVSARDGRRLGRPAARDRSRPARSVTLSPGATAHAVLRIVDVLNFPRGRCRPATARDVRVYPPNQRAASDVPFSFRACSRSAETFLSVGPVQPGVGVPGYPGI